MILSPIEIMKGPPS